MTYLLLILIPLSLTLRYLVGASPTWVFQAAFSHRWSLVVFLKGNEKGRRSLHSGAPRAHVRGKR